MASVSRKIKRSMHAAETGFRWLTYAEVARALTGASGDPRRAAGILGVHAATVYRKISESKELQVLKKKLEIERIGA